MKHANPSAHQYEGGVPVYVVHHGEDNPKACTAKKLCRFEMAREVPEAWPRGGLLLDPFTDTALSRADRGPGIRGIVALDCSWHKAGPGTFASLRKRNAARALPWLLAANRVAYGRAFQLSSAEAIAAACYILGEKAQAKAMMDLFQWGSQFLTLNQEPLDAYAAARNSSEVVAAQLEFAPDENPTDGA